jgi:hypothetical protein
MEKKTIQTGKSFTDHNVTIQQKPQATKMKTKIKTKMKKTKDKLVEINKITIELVDTNTFVVSLLDNDLCVFKGASVTLRINDTLVYFLGSGDKDE